MKTQIWNNHTQKSRKRNQLRAHAEGTFSVRIDGRFNGKNQETRAQLTRFPRGAHSHPCREFFERRDALIRTLTPDTRACRGRLIVFPGRKHW